MRLILGMALRNALRNRRRSGLTAATIMLGTALLTIGMSWIGGVFATTLDRASRMVGHVRVVTDEYARREQINPLVENIADVDPVVEAVRAVPGVTSAYPRIAQGVTAAVNGEIGERFGMLVGAPVEYYTEVMDLGQFVAKGRMMQGDDEVVLGKRFAADVEADVGDEVILLGMTQDGSMSPVKLTVSGIADTGGGAQDRQGWITLAKMQYMADMEGGATEVVAFGPVYEDADRLAAAVRASPGFPDDLDVESWGERPPFDTLRGFVRAIHTIAAAVIVFITALGVVNTMLMSVLERTAEIGVMRAFGLRAGQTVALFVLEAMGIAVVGGVLGVALGGSVAYYLSIVGVHLGSAVERMPATIPINETVYTMVTPEILAGSFALSLVMAIVGSFTPSLRATRIQPVEAMRHRR